MSESIPTFDDAIGVRTGFFVYRDPRSNGDSRALRVHYHRPEHLQTAAPAVFVMHGQRRNGSSYRNRWMDHADRHGFLLLAPEFDPQMYPSAAHYNLARMVPQVRDGAFHPEEDWAFHQIEGVFTAVRKALPGLAPTFAIYGHSAGAQFVHRLVLFHPCASFHLAVAANAGWYTLPCQDTSFPYGLSGTPLSDDRLAQSLQRPLLVLLGASDTDPAHPLLRRNSQALRQGHNRLERGHTFFHAGQIAATRLGVPLHWKLDLVPQATHLDRAMSRHAVRYLVESFPA